MTLSVFDPICFGQYPQGEEPIVLHFQYESSGEDIFRYILVDRIPITEIDIATRRKKDEGPSAESVRAKYWKKPEPPKPEPPKVEPPEVVEVKAEEDPNPVANRKKRGK